MSDLLRRVSALTPAQRQVLARQLASIGALAGGAGAEAAAPDEARAAARLVAYVVTRPGDSFDTEALREHAQRRLPDYMVPSAFVLLEQMPRTPAGKLDRDRLPGPAPTVPAGGAGFVAPRDEAERTLAGIWAEVLGLDEVGVHDDFFELGGDSLLSIRILARANQAGLHIAPERFFEHPTVAAQAVLVETAAAAPAPAEVATGAARMTPIQHWFFDRVPIDPQHWNQSLLLSLGEDVGAAGAERVIEALLRQHDALRSRFVRSADGWRLSIAGAGEMPATTALERVDLGTVPAARREAAVQQTAARINQGFDLARGPLLRGAWLGTPAGERDLLLVVAHHLVVDALSWRILLEDLEVGCRQVARGEAPAFAPATASFRSWTARLAELARSPAVRAQRPFWQRSSGVDAAVPADTPAPEDANLVAASQTLSLRLDADTTRAVVHDLPSLFHARINDVLLTALARVISAWSGRPRVLVDLEGHGREALFDGVDLSRTVGWFTTVFPVLLETDPGEDAAAALKRIKEALRRIPGNGLGHGLLRHLGEEADRDALRAQSSPELCFNYLGRLQPALEADAAVRLERDNCGAARSPAGRRAYVLEVNAQVTDGQLRMDWIYSGRIHRRATIERLAGEFLAALRELAERARAPGAGGFTPSDFPLADLDQGELDGLAQALARIDGPDADP